ncbi:RecB family exonuclease [Rhizosphaericola mali]|uniref:PD-(D/E)XK nuclease family protein n=1 Tax=Rhizosphaericola mali TaxID=2545455 RepID=A0A5P2FWC6_9BACT|nr:PD-(D/E)XK nuclease family protein [Rhizosphaericola mali]QES87197.1 PD-(D/E)XK nuclease family protein [Rhizosphaericola mali]
MEIRFFCNIAIMNDAAWFYDDLYILLQFLHMEMVIEQGGEAWYFQLLHNHIFQIPANEIAQNCILWNQQKQRKNSISSFRKFMETQVANVKIDLFSALETTPLHEAVKFITRIFSFAKADNWEKISLEISNLKFVKKHISIEILANYLPKNSKELLPIIEKLAIERRQTKVVITDFIFPFSKELIQPIVNKFVLSASSLNTYLECPIESYFIQFIKIPQPQNSAATYGSAIHFALEKYFAAMKNDRANEFPPFDLIWEQFERYMQENKASFLPDTFDNYLDKGENALLLFVKENIETWNKIVLLESFFKSFNSDNIPMKGFVDKIEFSGRNITIVDYKSGRFSKGIERLITPNSDNPKGGAYWRQAVFYKMLLDQSPKNWEVKKVEFDFLEPNPSSGNLEKITFTISEREEQIVQNQIFKTWNNIHKLNFEKGCQQPDCIYCNLARKISYQNVL